MTVRRVRGRDMMCTVAPRYGPCGECSPRDIGNCTSSICRISRVDITRAHGHDSRSRGPTGYSTAAAPVVWEKRPECGERANGRDPAGL